MEPADSNNDIIELGAVRASVDLTPDAKSVLNGVLDDKFAQQLSNTTIPFSNAPNGIQLTYTGKIYQAQHQVKLRNNLLLAVGFLELANAGDFAANVWNQIPVPIHAAVLMGIGGTLALVMVYFAAKDAGLSWANVKGLRAERRVLKTQLAGCATAADAKTTRKTILAMLDMNFRETGTELIDRVGMDSFLGFGALAVGAGTLMAIGGADPAVFDASNLLSGYIGNTPCAAYGLANLLWSAYVWFRARRHHRSSVRQGITSGPIQVMLKMRSSTFQLHSVLNGTTGVVAGAASLVTATMWWGYIVLAPCIVMSVLINLLWRNRVAYNRPLFLEGAPPVDEANLIAELHHLNQLRLRACADSSDPLRQLVSDSEASVSIMEFLVRNQLFEDYCAQVLVYDNLIMGALGTHGDSLPVKPTDLSVTRDEALNERIIKVAQKWFAKSGPKLFYDRERYLVEFLGCLLTQEER